MIDWQAKSKPQASWEQIPRLLADRRRRLILKWTAAGDCPEVISNRIDMCQTDIERIIEASKPEAGDQDEAEDEDVLVVNFGEGGRRRRILTGGRPQLRD